MTARAEKDGAENRAASGKLNAYEKERKNKNRSPLQSSERHLKTDGGLSDQGDNPNGPSGQVTKDSDL